MPVRPLSMLEAASPVITTFLPSQDSFAGVAVAGVAGVAGVARPVSSWVAARCCCAPGDAPSAHQPGHTHAAPQASVFCTVVPVKQVK